MDVPHNERVKSLEKSTDVLYGKSARDPEGLVGSSEHDARRRLAARRADRKEARIAVIARMITDLFSRDQDDFDSGLNVFIEGFGFALQIFGCSFELGVGSVNFGADVATLFR